MKKFLLALACASTLFGTSCLGPNNLFNGLNNWNGRVTEGKAWNELIFIGLNIIPVYWVALLGDRLIFNSIEWWGGENPISAPEPFETQGEKGWF